MKGGGPFFSDLGDQVREASHRRWKRPTMFKSVPRNEGRSLLKVYLTVYAVDPRSGSASVLRRKDLAVGGGKEETRGKERKGNRS